MVVTSTENFLAECNANGRENTGQQLELQGNMFSLGSLSN